MRKSAIFILIFTAIVLAGFYSYRANKASQSVSSATKSTATKVPAPVTKTSPDLETKTPPAAAATVPASADGKMIMSDVASHNTRNDCYLVVSKKVYDVSGYISNHPGGQGKIISKCGQEVTGIFADIHSNFAWNLLKNYQVGQL